MKDIVCNGCSLLCDDVSAQIEKSEVMTLGACRLGHAHLVSSLGQKIKGGKIRNDGKEKDVTLEKALDEAASVLLGSEKVLIYGLTDVSNESIEEARKIAKEIDADLGTSAEMGPQQAMNNDLHSMKLETDLEHVRNFGEFIIYWGSNPTESLHRHSSRFAVLPSGEKIPEGVESRTIGVIDVRETETMKMANHRFKIPIGTDDELLKILKDEMDGTRSISEPFYGIPEVEILGFIRGLKKSDCIVIFYGSGILNTGKSDSNLKAIKDFIESLRKQGKEAYALPMFPESNIMGFMKEIGPMSDSRFSNIINGEYDTILIIGNDVLVEIPGEVAKAMNKNRLITIGGVGGISERNSEISIYTQNAVVTGASTMNRIDMNEFKLVELGKPTQSMHEVLTKLREAITEKK